MGRTITWRDIFGLIKDKASLSKTALLSKPSAATFRLAILRATTHSPLSPPDDTHISSLLLLGNGSRATASVLISALMDRLHRTGNCIVALKSLLIIHNIIKRGPFILQDQLAIFPSTGGYNYLKLSNFRDGASAATWTLSVWVRWYARYLETLLSSSRVLGYFLESSSCTIERENLNRTISSVLNADIIKDVDSLVGSIEEICEVPDSIPVEDTILVKEIRGLLLSDYLSAVNEVSSRLTELNQRLSCLSFGDSVELGCALKRLQNCKEKLSNLYVIRKPSIESLWDLVQKMIDRVGVLKVYKEGGEMLSLVRRERRYESARVGELVQFQSGRFGLSHFSTSSVMDESVQLK